MDKREFLARQPKMMLLGTPQQKSPVDCNHPVMQFKGLAFVDTKFNHRLDQIFQCQDCGIVHRVPRSVAEAGRSGAIDLDDPRVLRTAIYNKSLDERCFRQFNDDGHCDFAGRGLPE